MQLHDHLGHLIPPGRVRRPHLEQGLVDAMGHRKFRGTPTRYVVTMHPADLAWLDPELPELLARSLERHAAEAGLRDLSVGVELQADARLDEGCPQFWAGFTGNDLLVLIDPSAAHEPVAAPQPVSR